jgi:hypothetical protein
LRPLIVDLELEDLPDSHEQTLKYIEKLENELKESRRKAIEDFCIYLLKDWRIGLHDQRVAFFEMDKSIEIQKNALR